MIQLKTIHIENFRGIRQMDFTFDQKNFGIYGPNGTGKSGIVDAIEFALTGSVTRLSGKGSGGLSVKSHGPHVDVRNDPSKAMVRIDAFSPTLSKSFSIERRVSAPKNPVVIPANDKDVNELVDALTDHPEFALSRREILKYIIAEPGQRSAEVQALLRLDSIETLRKSLKKAENDSTKSVESADEEVAKAKVQLQTALKIPQLTTERVLQAVNERRRVLGLDPLADLGKDTSLKTGVLGGVVTIKGSPRVSKSLAKADLMKLEAESTRADTPDEAAARLASATILAEVQSKPILLRDLQRRDFYVLGLGLIDEELCPLCDHEWDPQLLRAAVAAKVASAAEAGALKKKVEGTSEPFRQAIREYRGVMAAIREHAKALTLPGVAAAIKGYEEILEGFDSAIPDCSDLPATIAQLQDEGWRTIAVGVLGDLQPLMTAVAALPDQSAEDEAKDFLIRAEERLDVYRSAQRTLQSWKARGGIAKKVSDCFEEVSKAALNTLYEEVQSDFSRYYATIHHDDESKFLGKLTPSLAKLNFEVDFHGRGLFPPGAYHSEGHQDSMGLCLYLALMKKILGSEFRLAVLDDVLMSVDSGHRREVCGLLKKEFKDTQFIFTTHDQVWLNHMISEKLVEKKAVREFRRWSVDDGPHDWEIGDVWSDIDDRLKQNDVPGAAAVLRRFLERTSGLLAARLRAKVEFRRDGGHELSDLFDAATVRFKKLLEDAKSAAASWSQATAVVTVTARIDEFKKRLADSRADQWSVNASVHYNEWNSLTPAEFQLVAAAYRALADCFECPSCGGMFYVEPAKGSTESLRCDCGIVNLNLREKEKGKGKPQGALPVAEATVPPAAEQLGTSGKN